MSPWHGIHGIHSIPGALPLLLGFPDSNFVPCSLTQAGPEMDLALCVWDYPLPLGVCTGVGCQVIPGRAGMNGDVGATSVMGILSV